MRGVGGGLPGAWRHGTVCGLWGSSASARWETKPARLPPVSEWTPSREQKQEQRKRRISSSGITGSEDIEVKPFMANGADIKSRGVLDWGRNGFYLCHIGRADNAWLTHTSCTRLLRRRECLLGVCRLGEHNASVVRNRSIWKRARLFGCRTMEDLFQQQPVSQFQMPLPFPWMP